MKILSLTLAFAAIVLFVIVQTDTKIRFGAYDNLNRYVTSYADSCRMAKHDRWFNGLNSRLIGVNK